MSSPWFRRIALALGALVLLLAIALAVLLATFDANRFKTLAIDWMKTERQRTLVIDGPVELSVFPRIALKVSKLRLSERGRSDEFAAVDEAALAVAALPLLRKQVVVDRVSARGVRALYSRDPRRAQHRRSDRRARRRSARRRGQRAGRRRHQRALRRQRDRTEGPAPARARRDGAAGG